MGTSDTFNQRRQCIDTYIFCQFSFNLLFDRSLNKRETSVRRDIASSHKEKQIHG